VKTFEYELFKVGSNGKTLLEIFQAMHPVAAKKIDPDAPIEEQADSFVEKLKANKAKSELSHRLAVTLAEDAAARNNFTVPEYIKAAIKWVSTGE
jgi:predicted ATP-dependent endonuclease of OLD family